jgi:acetylornithine deacetylase/succinyl-diaminopimelate desuccinylase-like protein
MSDTAVKRISEVVEDNFSDQQAFLRKLVDAKSVNEKPFEGEAYTDRVEEEAAGVVYTQLKKMNLAVDRLEAVEGRPNIVCRMGQARARKSLQLHGHLDTAGVAKSGNVVREGFLQRGDRVYGVGIWNMKATLTAYVYAMKALEDMGVQLSGKLLCSFAADGLGGLASRVGSKFLMQRGIKGKVAIIGTPGRGIGIGHRGGYRFKLTTRGEAVHTGSVLWQRKEKGVNAIEKMMEVVALLSKTEIPFKAARAFPGKKPVFTFPTMIEGGKSINMVPDECMAYGDVRLLPGNSHTQVKMRIEEKLRSLRNVTYQLDDVLYVPAVEIDSKEEIVQVAHRSMAAVLKTDPEIEGIGPWNSGWVLIQKDVPTVVQMPLEGGVSRWGLEWVSVSSLKRLTAGLALSAIDYLGVK